VAAVGFVVILVIFFLAVASPFLFLVWLLTEENMAVRERSEESGSRYSGLIRCMPTGTPCRRLATAECNRLVSAASRYRTTTLGCANQDEDCQLAKQLIP
jgi:hypothetical protein